MIRPRLSPAKTSAALSLVWALCLAAPVSARQPQAARDQVVKITNGVVTVGVDRAKGGSITWLAWKGQPRNAVNIADPGRLIQQSYYAGASLDRREDGQHKAWSPWAWNPIQGGGVGSWARVTRLARTKDNRLESETIPKLWDMPDEEAEAVMRQRTGFEPGMRSVIVVECEFESRRTPGDRWGGPKPLHQELPACYFTRAFEHVRSYVGEKQWRDEQQPPGPPWGRADPPRKAMACFNAAGEGIAVFCPASTSRWNFGPHGGGLSTKPDDGPCMHVAPIATVPLGPESSFRFRYWLVVGSTDSVAHDLDALWEKYRDDPFVLTP
jgi:hypothetical protein